MCCTKAKISWKIVDNILEIVNVSQSIIVVLTVKRLVPLTTSSRKWRVLYLLWIRQYSANHLHKIKVQKIHGTLYYACIHSLRKYQKLKQEVLYNVWQMCICLH